MTPQSHLIGIIDVGTNTILGLVADTSTRPPRIIYNASHIARLGEGLSRTGTLSDAARTRATKAITTLVGDMRATGCTIIRAVGTAAMRRASNTATFIKDVEDACQLTIQVIDGQHEADLVLRGALMDFKHLPKPLAALDIGGGSTELIKQDNGQLIAESFNFGVVTLTETHLRSDPPTEQECDALIRDVRSTIAQHVLLNHNISTLIATAGTPTTAAALIKQLDKYDVDQVHGATLTTMELRQLLARLKRMTHQERSQIPCLPAGRADLIVAGLLILLTFMDELHLDSIVVSDKALRHGLLEQIVGSACT